MGNTLDEYIKTMRSRGYSDVQIRAYLLRYYPSEYVDKVLGKDTFKTEQKSKIGIFGRLLGIVVHPKKIFLQLKEEDIIHGFNIYALFIFIISVVLFALSFFLLKKLNLGILSSFSNIMLSVYIFSFLISALTMPFILTIYHYLFLKWIFRMKKSYEDCFKAMTYSIIQMWIFLIIIIPFLFIYFKLSNNFVILLTIIGVYLLIFVYNLITQIIGLSILCDIKAWKASIIVLLPILLAIGFVVVGIFFLKSILANSSFTKFLDFLRAGNS